MHDPRGDQQKNRPTEQSQITDPQNHEKRKRSLFQANKSYSNRYLGHTTPPANPCPESLVSDLLQTNPGL